MSNSKMEHDKYVRLDTLFPNILEIPCLASKTNVMGTTIKW